MAIREIVLDTETTGLDPVTGDRIVEIGCVELVNSLPTGQTFHVYIDPERDVPQEAFRVHGLSREFLAGKPKFAEIAQEFIDFIGSDLLVIHNAEFDIKFINAEFAKCGLSPIKMDRVLDTLLIARRKHPGSPNNLDALCSRYRIDNTRRTKHGALLDSEILAEVYLELTGGRQTSLGLAAAAVEVRPRVVDIVRVSVIREIPLGPLHDETEIVAHRELVLAMGDKALWSAYL